MDQGNLMETHANQIPESNKKRDHDRTVKPVRI